MKIALPLLTIPVLLAFLPIASEADKPKELARPIVKPHIGGGVEVIIDQDFHLHWYADKVYLKVIRWDDGSIGFCRNDAAPLMLRPKEQKALCEFMGWELNEAKDRNALGDR